MTLLTSDERRSRAQQWIDADPDPVTAAHLRSLLDAGDEQALASLVDTELAFGTAGLRGEVGAGPNRMNRATVIRTSRGLADHLLEIAGAQPTVVVGFDARPDSERFARDVVDVMVAAGLSVVRFAEPTPTPLVAFAARHLGASGAVVITASHNPPADNGYKVYDTHGVQISPPDDELIAESIARVGPANGVPGVDDAADAATVSEDVVDAYFEEIAASRSDGFARDLELQSALPRLVVTPLHGVGGRYTERAIRETGRAEVIRVESQWEPDGNFPTVDFPNPEEPGALDLAYEAADAAGAAVVLANDPDADRLAVAVRATDGWRRLTGDEVGTIFAHHLLVGGEEYEDRAVISSVVSSARLAEVADYHEIRHETTLTGFKWIWRAGRELEDEGFRIVLGYEEALGYSIGTVVRDKDGIAAAALMAEIVADLHAHDRDLLGLLQDLDRRYGTWVNVQRSVRREGEVGREAIRRAMVAARRSPDMLGGRRVTHLEDLMEGAEERPPWLPADDVVIWHLTGGSRVLIRPSGTEPKLKIYVDVRLLPDDDAELADRIADDAVVAIGLA